MFWCLGKGLRDRVAQLQEAEKIKPSIDATYLLEKTAKAFRYFAEGHTRGKVVITVPV